MSSKPITTNVKPQMLIKSTLYKTKKFFNKHLQSFIPTNRYQKRPNDPSPTSLMNSKLRELDDFYSSFSGAEKVKMKTCKVSERKRDEQQCGKSSITNSGLEDLKEERKMRGRSGRKQQETSPIAAQVLVQKMKDLEMMDLLDQAMDVEEVLHYYSRLNCPAYVEIIDKFFMDVYLEFHSLKPSGILNNSTRKLGSQSLNSSMRTAGPLKL